MKAILHIGIHKTGTSAIQQALGRVSPYLRLFGYVYPVFKSLDGSRIYNHSRVLLSLIREDAHTIRQNQIRGIDTPEKAAEQHQSFLAQLKRAAAKRGTLVLSGEGLCTLTVDEFGRLKNLLESVGITEFSIVAMLREHQSYLNSSLQQYVKAGSTLVEATHSATAGITKLFRKRLEAVSEVFGKEAVRVFSFETAKSAPEGLLRYFLNNVMPRVKFWPFGLHQSNESVSAEALELISFVNDRLPRVVNGRKSPHRRIGDLTPIYALKGKRFGVALPKVEACDQDWQWVQDHFSVVGEISRPHAVASVKPQFSEAQLRFIEAQMPKLDAPLRPVVKDFLNAQFNQLRDNKNAEEVEP